MLMRFAVTWRRIACVAGGFVGKRARARIPRNFVRGMGRANKTASYAGLRRRRDMVLI